MQPVVNQTIEGRSEVLDGKKYINCVFVKSTLIYKATASVSLEGCSFAEVGWIFEGPAERTMSFLRGLYHGAGEGGQQLVEKTFMSIKTLEPDKKIQPTATSGG